MDSSISENYSLFRERYEKLAGKVYLASKPAEAIRFVQQIISNSQGSKAIVAPISQDLEKELNEYFKKSNFPRVAIDSQESAVAHQINEADVGITQAAFAIAFTGTIVEVTTEDSHRLVSSLPRVHIAFLNASHIVNTLDEAAPRLREIFQKHGEYCNVTFISGPSRTADMELKLFLGVHGPQESHVIVCNWENRR